eukprot:12856153-Alexandrium_andersonii.AAC.1
MPELEQGGGREHRADTPWLAQISGGGPLRAERGPKGARRQQGVGEQARPPRCPDKPREEREAICNATDGGLPQ